MEEIGRSNRERFDDAETVDCYRRTTGLTPAERALFERHVPPGCRVLDLGVGTGRTTPWLAERAGTYLGIDLAPRMIAAARAAHPTVEFVVADAADLSSWDAGSFDVAVFSYNGIDYLPDPARHRCLDELHRVIAPGGAVILSRHQPRAVLTRPAAVAAHPWRGVPVAALISLRRLARLVPTRAFWTGAGWFEDTAAGGLATHAATPARAEDELRRHGFELLERSNGDLPAKPNRFVTPWWYYAARRP